MERPGSHGPRRQQPAWTRDVAGILVAVVIGGLAADAADGRTAAGATLELGAAGVALLALWWRRRAPVVVAAITFVAAAVSPVAAGAAIVAVYSAAVHRPLRIAAVVAALYLAPGAVALLLQTGAEPALGESLLGALVFTGGALGWGVAVRSRRQAADEHAASLAREAEARLADARAHERRRIAAEMHDVLAHRLSLLSLHAGAIELRPGMRPEDLATSAGLVRRNAHLALEDLRGVVGILRDGSSDTLAPSPTASDVATLLAESRDAGTRVAQASPELDLDDVPPDLGRHVYRVVQEGLTNARKHAPGLPVELTLTGSPGAGLRIEITNPVVPDGPEQPTVGGGVGLIGLEERVSSVGGTLDHGVDAAGLHHLRAHLPWPA